MEIALKHLGPGDAAWLVDQHGRAYAEAEGFDDTFGPLVAQILADFEAGHDPKRERAFIAWRGAERLGSVFCVKLDETCAKLRLFYLVPAARGLGLGQRLLDACMEFAREAGYERMQLWTHESHRAACALYARNGWELLSSKPVHSFGVDLVEQAWQVDLTAKI
ncbi:GNAT family N-acetyltransferase [Tropicibacter sp. R15_0]|uniref:GNAT family N-acetyltransferase n=1 Tax=Tropicibacter sp. R15_0 TaxID=2821101 RepID=UPI001ADC653B|nr:GNAT family N-acetyltransferase [Tropicibacter sp. R15_0]MBO9465101.1 GNAT family N-acetyltransferase [Tropicibacter sp. R15_0]